MNQQRYHTENTRKHAKAVAVSAADRSRAVSRMYIVGTVLLLSLLLLLGAGRLIGP
ncbi:MAG: hypothetical protein JKY34_05780 [Kordiimonadaceae bacterium]|nr:hypothetical protein [Kordiimonadaceae bacterium]